MVRNIISNTSGTGNQSVTAKRIVVRRGGTLNITNNGSTNITQPSTQQVGPYASSYDGSSANSSYPGSCDYCGQPNFGEDSNWGNSTYGASTSIPSLSSGYSSVASQTNGNSVINGRRNHQHIRNDRHTRNVFNKSQFFVNSQA